MLSLKNITQEFNNLTVLSDISFNVSENEIVAIMGPSGCGKSTLLKIISGIIKPTYGSIIGLNDEIAFVFQDDRLLPWKTTWENISLVKDEKDFEKIASLVEDVGLKGFEKYKPEQLSGGMKKRCGIARAFYYESKLLLMDEPFSGLDYYMRQDMIRMLLSVWEKRKQSILFVTHEIDEALQVADKIIILSQRPAKILSELTLPPVSERNLQSEKINSIRKEILSLTLK